MGTSVQRAMQAKDHSAGCLALGEVLALIGDKWSVLLVGVLSSGPARFNALMRQAPGISHRVLTLTLRNLEREGLVRRTVVTKVPLRVDYALTDLGRSLTAPLMGLATWAADSQAHRAQARDDYDRR